MDVQNDAGSQEDRCGQVVARWEGDAAGGACAVVDGGLNRGRVVVTSIAGGAEVGDGEGDWVRSNGDWEFDGGWGGRVRLGEVQ